MNSNKAILFSILFCFFGCGVKSIPRPPADSILPSITDQYLEKPSSEKDDQKKKNKKTQEGS